MTLYANGIHAATGQYLPPLVNEQVAQMARQTRPPQEELSDLKLLESNVRLRSLKEGDPADLAQAGWGVIFAAGDEKAAAVRDALKPLLDWRRDAAIRLDEARYRELAGEDGYKPGQTKWSFLSAHRAGPGPADASRLPYYLLLVGDPATIPYSFQYQIDIEYAVGRLWFEKVEDYARYAEAVVAAEKAALPAGRRCTFLGTRHEGDPCTALSSEHLVEALVKRVRACPGWTVEHVLPAEATKSCLSELFGGTSTPDLLFTATHGLFFAKGDPRLLKSQGALVCQDWPGPAAGAVEERFSFGAPDIGDQADVAGKVSFQFACFSAGSPALGDYPEPDSGRRSQLAERPFLAPLAQRLLSHPRGPALAVIGHVERAYPCSIEWPGAGGQIWPFESAIGALMEGKPVGLAMEEFGKRYAELSSGLDEILDSEGWGWPLDQDAAAQLWTASRDTRNYLILGDPAVRLQVFKEPEPEEPPPVFRDGGGLLFPSV